MPPYAGSAATLGPARSRSATSSTSAATSCSPPATRLTSPWGPRTCSGTSSADSRLSKTVRRPCCTTLPATVTASPRCARGASSTCKAARRPPRPRPRPSPLARYRTSIAEVCPRRVLDMQSSSQATLPEGLPSYGVLDEIVERYVEHSASLKDLIDVGLDPAPVTEVMRRIDEAERIRRYTPPGIKITSRAFDQDRGGAAMGA